MAFTVVFKRGARKQIRKLPREVQARIVEVLVALEQGTPGLDIVKLTDEDGLWRLRVGEYRIIYTAPDAHGIIRITKVGHRGNFYR